MAKVTRGDFFVLEHAPGAADLSHWQWLDFSSRLKLPEGRDASHRAMHSLLKTGRPIPFVVMKGRQRPDVFGNTADIVVYSGRLVRTLQEEQCKGLVVYPAVLYDRADHEIVDDDLFWVRPQVGAGDQDLDSGYYKLVDMKSWREDMNLPDAYGVYFDPGTWTGLDVFCFANSRLGGPPIMVTARIADAIRKGPFVGYSLERASEYARDRRDQHVRMLKERFPNGKAPPARPWTGPPIGNPESAAKGRPLSEN
jgi:hypothetical protein